MNLPNDLVMSLLGVFCAGGVILQLLMLASTYFIAKRSLTGMHQIEHELFGLAKKIEGLTAPKREILLKEFDQLLDRLSRDLAVAVSQDTGDRIVEAERKILERMAELGPGLAKDEAGKKKMEDLIISLEKLEESVIGSTQEVVQRVMLSSRRELIASESGDLQ